MKILILNWKDYFHTQKGGAEYLAHQIALSLSKKHEVYFFSANDNQNKNNISINDYTIIRKGNMFTMQYHAYKFYNSFKKKPDLIIEFYNVFNWFSFLYSKKETKILTLVNQLTANIYFYEFDFFRASIGFLLEKVQFILYKLFNNNYYICYSKSTKDDLINFRIKENKIYNFNLGINQSKYQPSQKSKDPSFICINRIVKNKRTNLAIEAFDKINKEFRNTKLYIFGTGRDLNNIKKLVNKKKLNDCIIFVDDGYSKNDIDKKIIYEKLSQAWALLLFSVREGWGLVVTEASASGTLSILSKTHGLRDSGKEGENCIFVNKNPNIEEIYSAMKEVIINKKLLKKLSLSSMKFSKKYSLERSMEEFVNIAENLN